MATITVRNIPDSIFEKIKLLSDIDHRSLNSELVVVIENGARQLEDRQLGTGYAVDKETQLSIWSELSGQWKDAKSKSATIREIYDARTMGRKVSL